MYFRYFVIISPCKRTWPFNWTKLNPFTKGCFVPSLVEMGPVAMERRGFFSISSKYFPYFVIIYPSKRTWLFIWINLNHLYKRIRCAKFGKIGPMVLEKKMTMWKVYRQTDRRKPDDRKSSWAFSPGKLRMGFKSHFICSHIYDVVDINIFILWSDNMQ